MRRSRGAFLVVILVPIGVALAGEGRVTTPAVQFPLTLVYDKDLKAGDKLRAIDATATIFHDLGIQLRWDPATVARITGGNAGLEAKAVANPSQLYDAVYYLTDLARLPARLFPLYHRILVVSDLKSADARSGKSRRVALAYDPQSEFLLVDHSHLNQIETFGAYMHPKVNFAMFLELAVEGRLRRLPAVAVRELGLEAVTNDEEWVRLNGAAGWGVYNGEDLANVGLKSTLRVTPPGIVLEALREISGSPIPEQPVGLGDANQPWWSPRHSPEVDRQTILRCMFSRAPHFFDRLAGANGVRADAILKEKTRLVLYATFVASGGVLDHDFWARRHPQAGVVHELTRDFNAGLLSRLQERLDGNPETAGVTLVSAP